MAQPAAPTLAPAPDERKGNDRGAKPHSVPALEAVAQRARAPASPPALRQFRTGLPPLTLKAAQPSPRGGLPAQLKTNVEALSGLAMDDVRVHRNSSEPAKLGALAYAQGSDIHLGPGQEEHLPHEAWHVVQQKQGRVPATTQMKGIGLNAEERLEAEANVVGRRAATINSITGNGLASEAQSVAAPRHVRQLQWGPSALTKQMPRDNTQLSGIENAIALQIGKVRAYNDAERKKIREWEAFLKSPRLPPPGYRAPNEVTVGPAKPKGPYDKRYSELMNMEMDYREEHCGEFEKKYLEQTGGLASEYVRTQMYMLNNQSSYTRWFAQDSPVSLWRWLEALSAVAGGRRSAPYGVVKMGMKSKDSPGRFTPKTELFVPKAQSTNWMTGPRPAFKHMYKYDARVRARAVEDPSSHNFPYTFDDAILATKPIPKANGYTIYQMPGALGIKTGVFEIGLTKDGVIDHRFFRSTK